MVVNRKSGPMLLHKILTSCKKQQLDLLEFEAQRKAKEDY